MQAPLEQLAEAAPRHPLGAIEMGVINPLGASFVMGGVEIEENLDHLSPIRARGISVEQSYIKLQVRVVVGGQCRTAWWLIEKIGLGHNVPWRRDVSILE